MAYREPDDGFPVTGFAVSTAFLPAAEPVLVRRGFAVAWIQQLKSRASIRLARFHATSTAARNRHHRNKSIPYERTVAVDRPDADNSRTNTLTGSTTAPAASSSRYGSPAAPAVSTNLPTLGTAIPAKSRPALSSTIMPAS
jgi:hypothetical protein